MIRGLSYLNDYCIAIPMYTVRDNCTKQGCKLNKCFSSRSFVCLGGSLISYINNNRHSFPITVFSMRQGFVILKKKILNLHIKTS